MVSDHLSGFAATSMENSTPNDDIVHAACLMPSAPSAGNWHLEIGSESEKTPSQSIHHYHMNQYNIGPLSGEVETRGK